MKIMAATRYDAASYYRLVAPFTLLKYRGVDVTVGIPSIRDAGHYDILWLQMHADPEAELLARVYKDKGKRVVYDVDDWLFDLPPSWPAYDDFFNRGQGTGNNRLGFHERLIGLADVVTTTTPYLARKIKARFPDADVRVLPNCIMIGDWETIQPTKHTLDGPVLGWFGTGNHWDDWMEIVGQVDVALENTKGYLALIGAPEVMACFPERLKARTRMHPLVPMDDFHRVRLLISACDVGLSNICSNLEVSRCRSPLKALQWGAAEVPLVASETVYGALDPERSRFLHVNNANQLSDSLTSALLSAGSGEMREMAASWRRDVFSTHSYEMTAGLWLDVADTLAE